MPHQPVKVPNLQECLVVVQVASSCRQEYRPVGLICWE